MIVENLTIEHFLGCVIFLPIFIYLTLVVFDGMGFFRDMFYTSNRRRRL